MKTKLFAASASVIILALSIVAFTSIFSDTGKPVSYTDVSAQTAAADVELPSQANDKALENTEPETVLHTPEPLLDEPQIITISDPSSPADSTPEPLVEEPAEPNVEEPIEPEPEEPVEPEMELVAFTGLVEHIFFHPAVAYPKLAFDGDNMSQGYDDWFVTADEFKKVIAKLHENNYILVDINTLITATGDNTIEKVPVMVPEGKKPLVISIDDMNYYEYMRQNGNVYKLILNEIGDVVTYSISPSGEPVISYDNDIVPILDQFVKEHPDFSLNGAKGTIALTGYEGTLGYQTHQLDSPEFAYELQEALKVVARLKETGWNFASHSYGHRDMAAITYDNFLKDCKRWFDEVGAIVGDTQVYIYPYGSSIPRDDKKFAYMQSIGFRIICGVGSMPYSKFADSYLFMDRRNVDGYAFRKFRDRYLELFDSNEMIDNAVRPAS